MVGLVIVSHSARLAEGVAELVRGVGSDLALSATGGLDLPGQPLGTDPILVLGAIEAVYSDDGVIVLMDLGSALLSAEMALEMLPAERREHVVLCEAPLVEGAVAAAVQARLGSPLSQVLAEARGALGPKAAQLGVSTFGLAASAAPPLDTSAASERRVRVQHRSGLHARPAALFVQTAGRYADTAIEVSNLTAGRGPADARSINAVITLGIRQGDEVILTATGPQAEAALDELVALLAAHSESVSERPESRAVSEGPSAGSEPAIWPLQGMAASPGIAVGRIYGSSSMQTHELPAGQSDLAPALSAAGQQAEWETLEAALARAASQMRAMRDSMAARAGSPAAEIFEAQLLFLADGALLAPARSAIFENGLQAATAWRSAIDSVAASYAALDDDAFRSRVADLVDVGRLVLANLRGAISQPQPAGFAEPAILVARDLSPAEVAHLDLTTVLAACTASGGLTSHAAILARALGIPYVAGLGEAILELPGGTPLAVDGDTGRVWPHPPPDVVDACLKRAEVRRVAEAARRSEGAGPAITRDGHHVEVAANIGSIEEARAAARLGADGIGLFRTEFLFGDRHDPPGEDEQVAVYRAVAAELGGRPLIIRTLDAGGDKPLPYLHMPVEANPFLGSRAIRLCLAEPELFLPQLKAIVRVAAEFPVKAMFPMIATVEEWREAVALLAAARQELLARGERVPGGLSTGMMVEVPAAALLAREFAREADFFSIGTNDLAQYTLAAERGSARFAALSDPLQPAVLRLIRDVVEAAHTRDRWVGLCGELAADPLAIPLLVGLGVDELSMNVAAVPNAKRIIRGLDYGAARALASEVLQVGEVGTVRAMLASARAT